MKINALIQECALLWPCTDSKAWTKATCIQEVPYGMVKSWSRTSLALELLDACRLYTSCGLAI
jgi:hypothetical protein